MDMQGRFVDRKHYGRVMKKYGFKYSPTTKTFVLSYPYLPRDFRADAVRVQLRDFDAGTLARIESVEYLRRGSGYKKTDKPGKGFKEYVENILREGIEQSQPRYLPS